MREIQSYLQHDNFVTQAGRVVGNRTNRKE